MKAKKVMAAISVYKNRYTATPQELKDLGFKGEPSKEYLKDEVLETLAKAYVDGVQN